VILLPNSRRTLWSLLPIALVSLRYLITGTVISEAVEHSSGVEALLKATDWPPTVGSPDTWPQSLRATTKLLLSSRYPMVLLWTDELIQIYNDAYIALIGDKHPHAFGRSIRETQPESWSVIGPMIREVMATRISNWVPNQQLPLNRAGFTEEAYFSLSYSAVEDDEGTVRGMLCVCSETTQQVLGERRLKLQRELSHAGGANSVDDSCLQIVSVFEQFSTDIPFAAIFLQRGGEKTMLDLVASTGIGTNIDRFGQVDLTDPSTPPSLSEIMRGETVIREEIDYLGLTGGPFQSIVTRAVGIPIRSSSSENPVGALVLGVNPNVPFDDSCRTFVELVGGQVGALLQSAQAYEDERRRVQELAELDKAKTAFFSNVSHEFRTTLTLLLGPLEEALASPETPPKVRETLLVSHRNGLRLLRLVNTLLDFSRIEAGRAEAAFEETDIGALTADLASNFRSICQQAGLLLDVHSMGGATAFVDPQMWEKIVLNLISNAFKFTMEGGIRVVVESSGNELMLRISDTGSGISADDLPRVFDRFYRTSGTRGRSFEGTGIGLAFVKELVAIHGGRIEAESGLGIGSTFTVTLPLGSDHLPPERIIRTSNAAPGSSQITTFLEEASQWLRPEGEHDLRESSRPFVPGVLRSDRPVILLADDNADMRSYVERLLSDRYEVVVVRDGEAAVETLSSVTFDLALLDVMMPMRDGFDVLAHVRSIEALRPLPVILLSARAGEEARIEGLCAGADDYLVKPFDARELVARIDGAIRLSRERRQAAILEAEARHAIEMATTELQRKEDTIAEINHRVKNNLQFLSSLIALTSRGIEDPQARERLHGLKERVVNLGIVHTLLYETSEEEEVEAADFLNSLSGKLVSAYGDAHVRLTSSIAPVKLTARQASPIGLFINEAILNALKHAFGDQPSPAIAMTLSMDGAEAVVAVEDNGSGFKGQRQGSSGLRLMETFARQLGGRFEIDCGAVGTAARLRFSLAND